MSMFRADAQRILSGAPVVHLECSIRQRYMWRSLSSADQAAEICWLPPTGGFSRNARQFIGVGQRYTRKLLVGTPATDLICLH